MLMPMVAWPRDPIIRLSVTHSNLKASSLLVKGVMLLDELEVSHAVLGLACGPGCNGGFLISLGAPEVLADIDDKQPADLSMVEVADHKMMMPWKVNFGQAAENPLAGKNFDAVMVFHYLYHFLIGSIKRAVRARGFVFYETFTQQRQFGRSSSTDFILEPYELVNWFEERQAIYYAERERAHSRVYEPSLVARKSMNCCPLK